jgi:pimeloyl-ACP methyl ester carboxylesterase
VVFAGYSYGSLITTRLPDLAALLAPFETLAPAREAREVAARARMIADQTDWGGLQPPPPSSSSSVGANRRSADGDGCAGDGGGGGLAAAARAKAVFPAGLSPLSFETHYLLVSPLLPPISTLTALSSLLNDDPAADEAHLRKFRENPALAVFGARDVFTSARRLSAWCAERREANARFAWLEVPGAGHFWHERGTLAAATRAVKEWIERNVGCR